MEEKDEEEPAASHAVHDESSATKGGRFVNAARLGIWNAQDTKRNAK